MTTPAPSSRIRAIGTNMGQLVAVSMGVLLVIFAIIVLGPLVMRLHAPATPLSGSVSRMVQDDRLHHAIIRTVLFALAALTLQIGGVALAIRVIPTLPPAAKLCCVFPALVPQVAAALAAFLFTSPIIGPLGHSLAAAFPFGMPAFFTDPWAMFGLTLAVDCWQWFPFLLACAVTSLERIPVSFVEQALIEGASPWAIWRRLLLAAAGPVFLVYGSLRLFDLLRLYDIPIVLFGGGGTGYSMETISIYIYKLCFQPGHEPYAAALSLVYCGSCVLLLVVLSRLPFARSLLS